MDLFIITGITKGLGYSINNILKKENKHTLAISRNTPIFKGNNYSVVECDLSIIPSVIEVTKEIVEFVNENEDTSRIVFINNAGTIEPIYRIGETVDYESIVKHINVNYVSPIIITNEIVKIMKEECKLEIINITTGAAERPLANWAVYSSSKKAMKMYFETIMLEDERINVINYDPGVMDTSMQEYIRNRRFPLIGKFVEYHNNNELKGPNEVANNIMKRYINTL